MLLKTAPSLYGFFDRDAAEVGRCLHEQYVSAQPFPHIVLDNFVDEEVLDRCLREFPSTQVSGTAYSRSQEKGKFEFRPEVLSPPLRSLFYSFNSIPFIAFVENLTGIKGLIPDPYFLGGGFHEVVHGGHLNIHADFNYHETLNLERRINLLIYLNRDWKEEYGGCFEIWDKGMRRRLVRIVPLFNRCVIFNTSSISLHGNPEPVNHPAGTPRRAIALYYYTATWDGSARSHTTQFKVRPDSTDSFDLAVWARELLDSAMPPILLRAGRKLLRVARRRQHGPVRSEATDVRDAEP